MNQNSKTDSIDISDTEIDCSIGKGSSMSSIEGHVLFGRKTPAFGKRVYKVARCWVDRAKLWKYNILSDKKSACPGTDGAFCAGPVKADGAAAEKSEKMEKDSLHPIWLGSFYSRKQYLLLKYRLMVQKMQSPLSKSFYFSTVFSTTMCMARIMMMYIFQTIEYKFEPKVLYRIPIFYTQIVDITITYVCLLCVFYVSKHRRIERVIKIGLTVAHILFVALVMCIVNLDRASLFKLTSTVQTVFSLLGVFLAAKMCRFFSRLHHTVYVAGVAFLFYYMLALYELWNIWSYGMHTSDGSFVSLRETYTKMSRSLSDYGMFGSLLETPRTDQMKPKVIEEISKMYLVMCKNLRVSLVLAVSAFFTCLCIIVKIKKKDPLLASRKAHRREFNLFGTLGRFLLMQMCLCISWVFILSVALLNIHNVASISLRQ
ncbi:uncharacterized protein NEMAJ01_1196 [Nematocida major]|uniref:uncharacterized protein n=1 Tax=Nematocida major TaxID=1912982 RepID=UPI002007EBC8|nr:uncharacterized protein NEMAJ01_1196 [Nematocida major]KAH9386300.1 hypothetical protein NEMAJ01_1196 [Nematocida major]